MTPTTASVTASSDEAPPLDRRGRPRRRPPAARPHRHDGRGQPAPEPEGAGAARQDGVQPVLRGLDPDPPVVRDGGQAAVGRRHDVQRRHVERQQGREPARHDRDGRRDGRRRLRHPPQGRAACRGRSAAGRRPASSTAATAGTPTRPRRCSTPTRSAPRSAAPRASTACTSPIVGDIRHSRVARSDVEVFPMLGADVTLVAPPTLLPPVSPAPTTDDLDSVHREGRRAVPVADATGADDRGARADACASTAPASA